MKTKTLSVVVIIMAILLVAFMIAKPFIPVDSIHLSEHFKQVTIFHYVFGYLAVLGGITLVGIIGGILYDRKAKMDHDRKKNKPQS